MVAMDQAEARFGEFFRELAVAGRALTSYPRGHPAAVGGLARACSALSSLLAQTGPVELGAAPDGLLWNERKFASPTAANLAKLLRRRRAGVLCLDAGVTSEELEAFLRALSLDTRSAQSAGSLASELASSGLVRLRVRDLDFSSIALVEGGEEASAPEAGSFAMRVIRRLLASGTLPSEQRAKITTPKGAVDLLQALFDTGAGGGGGVATWAPAAFAAALRAAAEDFCESPDAERAATVAALYPRLRGDGRSRLVRELAAAMVRQGSTEEPLAQLSAVLAPETLAEIRTATGEAALQKAVPSEAGSPTRDRLRLAGIMQAFGTEDVDTLRDVKVSTSALAALLELPEDRPDLDLSPAAAEVSRQLGDPNSERDAAATLLELVEREGVPSSALPHVLRRVQSGYLRLLGKGQIPQVVTLLENVQWGAIGEGPVPAALRLSAEWMSGPEAVAALAASLPALSEESLRLVSTLFEHLAPTAVRQLLGVLTETEDRKLRLLLIELLAKLGPVVARDAAALLSDSRWYVVRNMLLILRRVGDSKSVPAVRKCADHPDLRVRLEAIHNLFAFDREGSRELLRQALYHSDPREAEAAVVLAGKYGIAEAVEPIVALLSAWDLFGKRRSIRLEAIRALAAIGDPSALGGLGRFRSRFLPPALEERREFYRTLSSYPGPSRRTWIEAGLRSHDAEIRRLSGALASGAEAGP